MNKFLAKPVPPFPSEDAVAWKKEARQLGQSARKYLLDALFEGNSAQQYASLIALRLLGDEAWAEGYDDDMLFVVIHKGRRIQIDPKRHITVSSVES